MALLFYTSDETVVISDMRWNIRIVACLAFVLSSSITSCAANGPQRDGPLEVNGVDAQQCYDDMQEIEVLIGSTRLTNPTDEPLTTTGLSLVGDGDWTVIESAVMPLEYLSRDGRMHYGIGAGYYPPTPPREVTKWEEERTTIPGAVIEPGQTVDFAYRAKITPPSFVDHIELTYEDESGDEYVASNSFAVHVVLENANCDRPTQAPG